MHKFYYVASKGGREVEAGPFSSEFIAEAHLFCNNYYMPVIISEPCSFEEHEALVLEEDTEEYEALQGGEWTDLMRYNDHLYRSA